MVRIFPSLGCLHRSYSVMKNIQKAEKTLKNKTEPLSSDILKYLEKYPEYNAIRDSLPKYLLRKFKMPENIYLINNDSAEVLVKTVKNNIDKNDVIVEVNPGIGCLTKQLLKHLKQDIHLFEASVLFDNFIKKIEDAYPGRIHYKIADFFHISKIAFQDKMDGGNRVQEMLKDISGRNDIQLKLFGAMQSPHFFKHLITMTLLFHSSSNLLGRPDMYIVMPAFVYKDITENFNEIPQRRFRRTPALFQLIFDFKVLTTFPREHFLPGQFQDSKVEPKDANTMYLTHIRQKDELPCHPDYLPLLWYFFRVNIVARSVRVIPYLEQWIPGCGVWLITGQDPPETDKNVGPTERDEPLPHMTIFTQFGDLTLRQKLTVFKRFISWPEFEQSAFRSMAESDLPKVVSEPANQLKETLIDQIEDHDEKS